MRVFFLCAALISGMICAAEGSESEARLTAVRQAASAGVYIQYCPTIRLGPGLAPLMRAHGVRPEDLAEGGRFRQIAVEHAGNVKALMKMAGTDTPAIACKRALEMYGPAGFVAKDVVAPK